MSPKTKAENFRILFQLHRSVFGFFAYILYPITFTALFKTEKKGGKEKKENYLSDTAYLYAFPETRSWIETDKKRNGLGILSKGKIRFSIDPNYISGAFLVFRGLKDLKTAYETGLSLEVTVTVKSMSENYRHLLFCMVDKYNCKIRLPLENYQFKKSLKTFVYRIKVDDLEMEGEIVNPRGRLSCQFQFDKVKGMGFEYICQNFLNKKDVESVLEWKKAELVRQQ